MSRRVRVKTWAILSLTSTHLPMESEILGTELRTDVGTGMGAGKALGHPPAGTLRGDLWRAAHTVLIEACWDDKQHDSRTRGSAPALPSFLYTPSVALVLPAL